MRLFAIARGALLALALPGSLAAQTGDLDAGIQLYRARKYVEAKAAFESASKAGNATATYWLGRVAMEQNKWDDATDYFERAVKANDASSEFHLWLGRAYGEKAQRASVFEQPMLGGRTRTEFEVAVARDPKNLDARSDLITFYMVAPGVMGGSHEKARQQADEIRKINQYRGDLELIGIADREKNASLAESGLRALVKAFPDSAAPMVRLIISLQAQQKWDETFALIDGVLAKHPDEPTAWYQLGKTAAMSGQRLDAGEAALRKYLTVPPARGSPSPAGAHYRLGMIAERRGNSAAAKSEYETAVSLEPKLEDAKKALAKLK